MKEHWNLAYNKIPLASNAIPVPWNLHFRQFLVVYTLSILGYSKGISCRVSIELWCPCTISSLMKMKFYVPSLLWQAQHIALQPHKEPKIQRVNLNLYKRLSSSTHWLSIVWFFIILTQTKSKDLLIPLRIEYILRFFQAWSITKML